MTKRRCPGFGGGAAEAAMRVEDRQQGERDAGLGRGRRDRRRHLGGLGVGAPVGVVVQVVELADTGEARLQHLHEGQRGDRLEIVGCEPLDEAVHRVAPGPEIVAPGAARRFGEPRHGALEGVAVEIGQTRQPDRMARVARLCRRAGLDRGDAPARECHPHLVRPAVRQQRRLEPQCHGPSLIDAGH